MRRFGHPRWSLAVAVAVASCAPRAVDGPASPAPAPAPPDAAPGPAASSVAVPARSAEDRAWRVAITDRGRTEPRYESWPAFDHRWDAAAPESVVAERTVCLPKGRYVFELATAPSFTSEVTFAGAVVIQQDHFPSVLSFPLRVDGGCARIVVRVRNPLRFAQMQLALAVREVVDAACDASSFPRGSWNACLFRGRRREEPLGTASWAKLEVPKGQPPGNNGQFDWYAIEARTTLCFDKGTYVFHTRSDDTLTLSIDGRTLVETPPTRLIPTAESPPVALSGCVPVTVIHTYRYEHSLLDVAWAKVGSPEERRWARERPCSFACDDDSVCTKGEMLPNARPGQHVCVPTTRLGHEGEYCDAKHPCAPGAGVCTVVHGCYQP